MSRIKAGCSREIPTWDMVTIPPIREPGATEKFSPPAHPDEDGEKERMGYRVLISPMSSSYVQKGIQTASWGLQGQYQEQVLFIPVHMLLFPSPSKTPVVVVPFPSSL